MSLRQSSQDSILVSVLAANNALEAKRQLETCSFQLRNSEQMTSIITSQRNSLLSNQRILIDSCSVMVMKSKEQEIQIEILKKKKKAYLIESWAWRIGVGLFIGRKIGFW